MKVFIEKVSRLIQKILPAFLVITFLASLGIWLFLTPPGLLGKADAVGYAVCHRIPERSFNIGDRSLPLCARCSGMHLGAFFGMIYLSFRGKAGGLPRRRFLVIFALFLLAFGLDGINSYTNLVHLIPSLYQTQNWMRLVTGTFLGTGIAALLYPIANQSFWRDWSPEPVINTWKQMGGLILMGGLIILSVLSENTLLLYPLAVISAVNVLLVLGLIYTIIWIMLTRKDNQFESLWQVRWYFLAGVTSAVIQIAVMDYARFLLTGTWNGLLS